jgi:hypothetical protein
MISSAGSSLLLRWPRCSAVRFLLVVAARRISAPPYLCSFQAPASFCARGRRSDWGSAPIDKIDRHGGLSEIHQFSAVTLVMADVSEEFIAVSLGEVSPYSDLILAYDLHHILDRFHDIVERCLRPSSQERGKHRNPDKTALVGDDPQLLIGFVARVCLERRWKAVRMGDRLL